MSGYPVVLNGDAITALVVGGGPVAERKTRGLLAAGATVRVVAPVISAALGELALSTPRCTLVEREYESGDLSDVTLVVAATDQREINARVSDDARRFGKLVNVADAGATGDFVTPATHSCGELLVAVTAGGVPAVAARVRDALAERFDARYAYAIRELAAVRARLLDAGDRAGWRDALDQLLRDGFCERVDSGEFAEEMARWRY